MYFDVFCLNFFWVLYFCVVGDPGGLSCVGMPVELKSGHSGPSPKIGCLLLFKQTKFRVLNVTK